MWAVLRLTLITKSLYLKIPIPDVREVDSGVLINPSLRYTSQCSISSLSCLVGVGMAKWNQFSVSFACLTVVKFPARRMYISQIGGTRPGHSFRVYKNGIYSCLPPFPVLLVAAVSPITANNRIITFILPKWHNICSITDISYYSLVTFKTKLSNGLLILPKSLSIFNPNTNLSPVILILPSF